TGRFGPEGSVFGKQLASGSGQAKSVEPAVILTPEGAFPVPAQGERFGDFKWTASRSADVKAEIAEFDYGYDVRLFFVPAAGPGQERQVSAGLLATANAPWTWRVWSVAG